MAHTYFYLDCFAFGSQRRLHMGLPSLRGVAEAIQFFLEVLLKMSQNLNTKLVFIVLYCLD